MNFFLIFLTWMYARLLRLYPARFRQEFSKEMQTVFEELAHEIAKKGLAPLLVVCLRELCHLPGSLLLEFWHEGFEPALLLRAVKEGTVGTIRKMWWVDVGSWQATLASLLPLWLLILAILPEGRPRLPIPDQVPVVAFVLSIAICIFLLWKGWMTVELALYSFLFPFILVFAHDEMSSAFKTPLFLLSALFLTIGIVGYHYCLHRDAVGAAWLLLLFVFIATWIFNLHVDQNYWQMAGELGYNACDSYGCVPLAPKGTSLWTIFFRVIRGY